MNQVTLVGRITRNLSLRNASNGKPFVYFSIAINSIKDRTDYVNCVAWDKTAENMAKYVGKGSLVSVVGRITTRRDNRDQTITEVVANNVAFLGGKRDEQHYQDDAVSDGYKNEHQQQETDNNNVSEANDYDSEISFINNKNVNAKNVNIDNDDEAII